MDRYLLIALAATVVLGLSIIVYATSRVNDTASSIRAVCAQHGGVSRVDSPFVVCRDGYLGKY